MLLQSYFVTGDIISVEPCKRRYYYSRILEMLLQSTIVIGNTITVEPYK
jgi:hypothetical protein